MRVIAAIALTVFATPAHADTLSDLRTAFAYTTPACYAARYDAAHLRAYPEQTVASLKLVRGQPQMKIEEDKYDLPAERTKEAIADRMRNYTAVLADFVVTFRPDAKSKGSQSYAATVSCNGADPAKIRCGIDCDGGGFVLQREPSGALRVILEQGNVRMAGGCSSRRERRYLGTSAGDRAFTLAPSPMAACR